MFMILTIIGTVLAAFQFIIAAAGAGLMNYDDYFELLKCDAPSRQQSADDTSYIYYTACRQVIQ